MEPNLYTSKFFIILGIGRATAQPSQPTNASSHEQEKYKQTD